VAAEGRGVLSALDIDFSNCGLDRARSLAKTIKGAKKAAYYPRTRRSAKNLARRLASPFLLPAASSCHEVLTVAQLDKAGAACADADVARPDEGFCHVAPRLSLPRPHLAHLSLSAQGLRKNLWVERRPRRGETPAAHSVPARRAAMTCTKRRARHRACIRSRPG
jgi:hypothetical protein